MSEIALPYQFVLDRNSKDKIIFTPISEEEIAIMKLFRSWKNRLDDYNINISTGPVVSFRAKDYLDHEKNESNVPLIWLNHVKKMKLEFPKNLNGKSQYIRDSDHTKSILLQNKNYILLRRFSSKDDKSRLVAAPYFGAVYKYQHIGIENKVNYFYRKGSHLTRKEIMGLSAILNSKLFDNYFRIFNGNVNVSATELRAMPIPPLEKINEIGETVILKNSFDETTINYIVNRSLQNHTALN